MTDFFMVKRFKPPRMSKHLENRPENQALSISAILLAVFTVFLWGLWPVVSRFSILDSFNPVDIVALRFWVAGIVLLPYLLKKGWGGMSVSSILFASCAGGMLYVFVALTGLSYAPSGHAGMIIPSTMMSVAVMGSWLIFGDKPSLQKIAGILIIVSGIVTTNYVSFDNPVSEKAWVGHLLFIAAGFCWGSFTVAARKARLPALHMTAIVSVVSMVVFTPLYFIFGDPKILETNLNDVLFQAIFQGLIISILALYTYTKTIELMGATRAALFGALVPGFAVLIAYPVLNEIPQAIEILGLVLVTIGMVVTLRSK